MDYSERHSAETTDQAYGVLKSAKMRDSFLPWVNFKVYYICIYGHRVKEAQGGIYHIGESRELLRLVGWEKEGEFGQKWNVERKGKDEKNRGHQKLKIKSLGDRRKRKKGKGWHERKQKGDVAKKALGDRQSRRI